MNNKKINSTLQLDKTTSLLVTVLILLAFSTSHAQNCKSKFESSAGPDIDVCAGGQVNLNGIIGGDASKGIWKGGKGIFEPSRNSTEVHYFPAEDEKGNVVLTLEAFNPKFPDCVPARSNITLTLHREPHVTAGENLRIQPGSTAQLQGTSTGDAKQLTWKTAGTGTFTNVHQLNALYTPSKTDIKNGGCSLTLVAEPFPGCPPDNASISLSIAGIVQPNK